VTVRTGLERLFEDGFPPAIEGKRIGLVTNQTGIDTRLRSTIDLLAASDLVRLTALFGPEHGAPWVDPFRMARALHALRSHGPVDFAWREAANGRRFVDRLLGSDQPRRQLDAGASAEDVLLSWDTQATSFEERTQVHLLYE
jgi:uncharacterized protein YbbC (DUF1343 family)